MDPFKAQDNQDKRDERRRNPRVSATFVEYSLERRAPKKTPTFTENISSNGICLLISNPLSINAVIFLTVYLFDGGDPINVEGKVVWVKESGFLHAKDRNHYDAGIEFAQISRTDQERIRRYTSKVLHQADH
ncbi:MAG: PilZ domain-containing protein [Candidatus Omnitrophota bacterium]